MRRLLVLALVGLCLTPGTWLRTTPPPADTSQILSITPLESAAKVEGEAQLESAWHLTSSNQNFGSYSALLLIGDDEFLAGSDRGKLLRFGVPDAGSERKVEIGLFTKKDSHKKQLIDLESLTRDPDSGRIWIGYEGTNAIERVDSKLVVDRRVQPDAMQMWPPNSGAEAMARLTNGSFVVISEGFEDWGDVTHPALKFANDPADGAKPISFQFSPPEGYRPVDMTQLPDGRVLILVRDFRLGVPPRFLVKLVVADPQGIEPDGVWSGREIASITDSAISDNYEGLAVAPNADGSLAIWLISDDNNASFQRTLLLKLRWNPKAIRINEKAPENLARPS